MAFEAWSVSSSFIFESNARSFFPPLLRQVEKLTASIDALTASADRAGAGVTAFGAAIREGSTLIRGAIGSLDGIVASTDAVGSSAVANARKFVSATSALSDGITEAAASVSDASTIMNRRLGLTTAAANRAAAAIGRVNVAGRGSGGSGGGGGGIGPGAAAAAGGAGRFAGAAEGVGLVAALTAGIGVKVDSENQAAVNRIAGQTGRKPADVAKTFLPIAYAGTNRTGMSVSDALDVTAQVSAIIKDPKELRASIVGDGKNGGILDLVSVLKAQGVGGSPAEIAKEVATVDHMLNAYSGPAMARVNDKLYRYVVATNGDLSKVTTQMGYFSEQYRLAGGTRPANIDDIFAAVQLGVAGIGHGKWGSGFGQILRTISRYSKEQKIPLEQLGVLDANGNLSSTTENEKGEFTPMAMINEMRRRAKALKLSPIATQELVNRAFPANAARVVSEAMSPKTTAFLARSAQAQASLPSLMATQAVQMQRLDKETERLEKNFGQLAGVLAGPIIQPLTSLVTNLGTLAYNLANFLRSHPSINSIASSALVGVGALGIGALLKNTLLPMIGIGSHGGGAVRAGGSSILSRAGAIGGDLFPIVGRIGNGFRAFGEAISKIAGPIGKAIGGFSIFGRSLSFLAKGAIPVAGDVYLIVSAIKALKDHSFDVGFAIGKAARWIHDAGGPMIAQSLQYAFISGISILAKSIVPYIRDTVVSNVLDGLGIKHKAMGFDSTMEAITGGIASGAAAGYGPQIAGAGVTPYTPNVLVNHGTINVRSNNPKDFYAELTGKTGPAVAQHRAASTIGGTSPMFAPALMTPNGGSGAK